MDEPQSITADLTRAGEIIARLAGDDGERQRLLAAISRSRGLLDAAADNPGIVVWAVDRQGMFTLSEGRGLEALGLRRGEVLGRSLFALYAASPPIVEAVRRALQGQTTRHTLLLNGVHFQAVYAPLHDETGAIDGAAGLAIDVTQARLVAEELQLRDHRLRKFNEVLFQLAKSKIREVKSLDDAFGELARVAANTLQVDRVGVWLLDERRETIRCRDVFDRRENKHRQGWEIHRADCPAFFAAFEQTRTFSAPATAGEAHLDDPRCHYHPEARVASLLGSTARLSGEAVGVIVAEMVEEPRVWSFEDEHFLGSIADLAALTLEMWQRTLDRAALQARTEQFQTILTATPSAIVQVDEEGRILFINERTEELFGYAQSELLGRPLETLLPERFQKEHVNQRRQYLREPRQHRIGFGEVLLARRRDGSEVPVDIHLVPLRTESGTQIVADIRDLSEQREAMERVRLLTNFFDSSYEGIVITDADATILDVNPHHERVTGYARAEVLGKNPRMMKSNVHDAEFYRRMWRSLLAEGRWQGEVWDRKKNGELYAKWLTVSAVRNERGRTTHYVGVFSDITAVKQNELRLEYMAHYDPLTELPNRVLFRDRCERALTQARLMQRKVGLLFFDLDGFKHINDTLGHRAGDKLLRQIALRLKDALRIEDTVARLGGDEFIIVLPELTEADEAARVADKLLAVVAEPYLIDERELFVTASIGISLFPDDDETVDKLLQNADLAMYTAKGQGKNARAFYSAQMTVLSQKRLETENLMRRALERDEFFLVFQPQAALADGAVVGAEVLVRWQHPKRGLVEPDAFIQLAEETGLIVPIGEWVLHKAAEQLRAWRAAGRSVDLAVNLSPRQFRQPHLVERVADIVGRTGLRPRDLKLEITESVLMEDVAETRRIMNDLTARGFRLAIDDFGTGFSSLAYLKHLPLHSLKIDKSFVSGLPDQAPDVAIVRSIVTLAKALSLEVVAEGIERPAQRQFLAGLGCDRAQGFLVGEPMSAEEFARRFFGGAS